MSGGVSIIETIDDVAMVQSSTTHCLGLHTIKAIFTLNKTLNLVISSQYA